MSVRFIGQYRPGGRIKVRLPYKAPEVPVAPTWVTNQGFIGTYNEGTVVDFPLVATDPNNDISTYEVVSGELPPGISLNLFSGHLLGTVGDVTANKVYTFGVKVTDRTGLFITGSFEIQIVNVASKVAWVTPSGNIGEPAVGEDYRKMVEANSN